MPGRKGVAADSTLGKIRLENQDVIKCQVKLKLAEKHPMLPERIMGQLHGVDHIQGADPGRPGVRVERARPS